MNGKSDRPISFSVSFCICGRSFKLISFTFVCERETLGAVHSTQLWVLVKYGIVNMETYYAVTALEETDEPNSKCTTDC